MPAKPAVTVDSLLDAKEYGQAELLARETENVPDRIEALTKVQAAYRDKGDLERANDIQVHLDLLKEF